MASLCNVLSCRASAQQSLQRVKRARSPARRAVERRASRRAVSMQGGADPKPYAAKLSLLSQNCTARKLRLSSTAAYLFP